MTSPLPEHTRPEKALWYQEVLSLDPASRIFLPYARLLADTGRRMEAIEVLRSGLSRHPEFLEARLLLIDLLHAAGMDAAAGLEASTIIESLSRCSSLWEIWSGLPGVRADQAAMLLYFGATFRQGGPGLAEVFDAGIKALRQAADSSRQTADGREDDEKAGITAPPPAEEQPSAPVSAPSARQDDADRCFVMDDATPWYGLDSVPEDDDYDDTDELPQHPLAPSVAERFFAASPDDAPSGREADPNQDHTPVVHAVPRSPLEGKSSLCTRSMARILEEQGATGEAADIYRELLEVSSSPEERAELNAKLDSLMQGTEPSVSGQSSASGILSMLETLAVRLENKSRA